METTTDLNPGRRDDERLWFRTFGILSLLWLAAYSIHWFTWDYLWSALSGLALLGGPVLSAGWLIGGAVLRSKRMIFAGLIVFSLFCLTLSGRQQMLKARFHLWRNEQRYQEIVLKELESPLRIVDGHRNDEVEVDIDGGGFRVAFDLGGGFMGDFPSIVYDREGSIRVPSSGEFAENEPFNGQYHSVQHLKGPWYFVRLYPD